MGNPGCTDEGATMDKQRVKPDVAGRRKSVVARIARIEAAIKLANDYLETGEHADWHGLESLVRGEVQGRQAMPSAQRVGQVRLPAPLPASIGGRRASVEEAGALKSFRFCAYKRFGRGRHASAPAHRRAASQR